MRKKTIIALILFALLIYGYGMRGNGIMKSILPEADSFKKVKGPFQYYEAYSKGRLIGYYLDTEDVTPERWGYSGPIQILVGVDREFKILNLKVLHYTETPEYASGIAGPEFLNQFKGKGPDAKFRLGDDIDGITRATVSCVAICDILKTSINRLEWAVSGAQRAMPGSVQSAKMKEAGLQPREAAYYKVIDE